MYLPYYEPDDSHIIENVPYITWIYTIHGYNNQNYSTKNKLYLGYLIIIVFLTIHPTPKLYLRLHCSFVKT